MLTSQVAEAVRYEVHPEVLPLRRPDGSLRLLHFGGNVCALDAEACVLLGMILEQGEHCAARALADAHGLGMRAAEVDVRTFVAQLCRERIVRERRARGPWFERSTAWASELATRGALRALAPSPAGLGAAVARATAAGADSRQLSWTITRLLWLARWSIAQHGWSRAVSAWRFCYPQPGRASDEGRCLPVVDRAVRTAAARSLLGIECKERGLVSFAALRASGIPADLVIGVSHDPLEGHVWTEALGTIVSDDPEHCLPYVEVARFR
jgi:Transglutaminase-like superfamily